MVKTTFKFIGDAFDILTDVEKKPTHDIQCQLLLPKVWKGGGATWSTTNDGSVTPTTLVSGVPTITPITNVDTTTKHGVFCPQSCDYND
jgi:hypothetical protein